MQVFVYTIISKIKILNVSTDWFTEFSFSSELLAYGHSSNTIENGVLYQGETFQAILDDSPIAVYSTKKILSIRERYLIFPRESKPWIIDNAWGSREQYSFNQITHVVDRSNSFAEEHVRFYHKTIYKLRVFFWRTSSNKCWKPGFLFESTLLSSY